MTETVIKICCIAFMIGTALSLVKDGGLKSYASVGMGLVFTVSLISSAISLLGGNDEILQGGLSASITGKLKNALTLSEIKASGSEENDTDTIIKEYTARLSKELQQNILKETGLESTVNFVVCQDITSSDFGNILHVYCKMHRSDKTPEMQDQYSEESKKDNKLEKIEITPEGIYINGTLVGDDKKDAPGSDRDTENSQQELIAEQVYKVINAFCGAEKEKCSIFWEEKE